MFGFGIISKYRPKIKDDEELHELIIDLNARDPDQNSSVYMINEISKKANRLGKEKMKILRVEYDTDKTSGEVTVWFICEYTYMWGR